MTMQNADKTPSTRRRKAREVEILKVACHGLGHELVKKPFAPPAGHAHPSEPAQKQRAIEAVIAP